MKESGQMETLPGFVHHFPPVIINFLKVLLKNATHTPDLSLEIWVFWMQPDANHRPPVARLGRHSANLEGPVAVRFGQMLKSNQNHIGNPFVLK